MLGNIKRAIVERETQIGYLLKIDEEEIFLHYNECDGKSLTAGEVVDAFVYLDKKNRIAATLAIPNVTLEKTNFGKVVEVKDFGAFVNIGISKDILISSDDLPVDKAIWPIINDEIVVILRIVRDRLVAKPVLKNEIEVLKKGDLLENSKYTGYVYRISSEGINVVTKNFNTVFIYFKLLRKSYRVGEKLEFRVTKINENDALGTTIENKEFQIIEDAKSLYQHMLDHNHVLNFTEKTDPDIVYRVFKMSKKAFKNAIGYLYKRDLILIKDDKIVLIEEGYNFEN